MSLPTKTLLKFSDVQQNRELFEAVQGYTLVPHGKELVWLGLLRYDAARLTSKQHEQVAQVLCSYGDRAHSAYQLYMSYNEHVTKGRDPDGRHRDEGVADTIFAVGLSSIIYGIDVPGKPVSPEFDQGFAQRFSTLPEVKGLKKERRYAAIIVLAGNKEHDLQKYKQDITTQLHALTEAQLVEIIWEEGYLNRIKGADGKTVSVDHFGYQEGISQPVFFDIQRRRTPEWTSGWDPAIGLGCVLTRQPKTRNDSPGDSEYGSFLAFLKIEQKITEFESVVNATAHLIAAAEFAGVKSVESPNLGTAAAAVAKPVRTRAFTQAVDLVKGHLMGRTPDGEPLADVGKTDRNDFDFAKDPNFSRCPVTAHIRKVNPRTEHNRNKRVLRRGVLYGKEGEERGTLFQCFQSDLARGFEHLFREWAMNEDFPTIGAGKDALLASSASPASLAQAVRVKDDIREAWNVETKSANISESTPPEQEPPLQAIPANDIMQFTEIKAGEYFYFPSRYYFGRMIKHFKK